MNTTNIAATILLQLGGARRLSAMIGARAFVAGDRSLTVIFAARAKNGANRFTVTLDESDTYTVSFDRVRGVALKSLGTTDGIYADRLRFAIESATGLYLSI